MSRTPLTDRLGRVRFLVDSQAHIRVDPNICAGCKERFCVRVCPAECFAPQGGELSFSYQSCLECGACRVACRNGAVDWNYPRGGFGVCFRCS